MGGEGVYHLVVLYCEDSRKKERNKDRKKERKKAIDFRCCVPPPYVASSTVSLRTDVKRKRKKRKKIFSLVCVSTRFVGMDFLVTGKLLREDYYTGLVMSNFVFEPEKSIKTH
jgi:hypothetical protein